MWLVNAETGDGITVVILTTIDDLRFGFYDKLCRQLSLMATTSRQQAQLVHRLADR